MIERSESSGVDQSEVTFERHYKNAYLSRRNAVEVFFREGTVAFLLRHGLLWAFPAWVVGCIGHGLCITLPPYEDIEHDPYHSS